MDRSFKGVWISKEIWFDKRLTPLEKIILIEIDSLDDGNGCYASNKYLAEFCQCSVTKISNAVSKLIDLEYIYLESFNGKERVLRTCITKFARQTYKICKADLQNLQGSKSNIYINNNIYENTNRDNVLQVQNASSKKTVSNAVYAEIVNYLNEKQGTHFKSNNKATQSFINARFKEGFTLEDFKKVIDNKVAQWGKSEKMCVYLRPKTLFSGNFESYLNENVAPRTCKNSKKTPENIDFEALYDDVKDIENY